MVGNQQPWLTDNCVILYYQSSFTQIILKENKVLTIRANNYMCNWIILIIK